jgi:hypothetical protein
MDQSTKEPVARRSSGPRQLSERIQIPNISRALQTGNFFSETGGLSRNRYRHPFAFRGYISLRLLRAPCPLPRVREEPKLNPFGGDPVGFFLIAARQMKQPLTHIALARRYFEWCKHQVDLAERDVIPKLAMTIWSSPSSTSNLRITSL